MAALPFLVEYGGWIAAVSGASFGGVMLGAYVVLRRARARWAARAEVASRAMLATEPGTGATTVRGVYRAHAIVTESGERLELVGTPEIILGTGGRFGAPTLADGDHVIATARLERQADPAASTAYRTSAGKWIADSVELVAEQPRAFARPLGGAGVALGIVFVLIGYLALVWTGRFLVDAHVELDGKRWRAELPSWHRLAVAAALPGARGRALELLDVMAEREVMHGDRQLEQQVALARLYGGCHEEAFVLEVAHQFERELDVARGCDDERVLDALLSLGRYDEAAGLAKRGVGSLLDRGDALIGAGRWADAATVVEEAARQLETPTYRSISTLHCFADFLREHGGDARAHASLAANAKDEPTCALLLAIANRDPDEIVNVELPQVTPLRYAQPRLAWAFGATDPDSSYYEPFSAFAPIGDVPNTLWLAPGALAGREGFDTHLWMTSYLMMRGAFAAARAESYRATTLDNESYDGILMRTLQLGLDLRTGARIEPSTRGVDISLAGPVAVRAGLSPDRQELGRIVVTPSACAHEVRPAFVAAERGDGGPLARLLAECDVEWSTGATYLIAVAPLVTRERDAFVAAVRTFVDARGHTFERPLELPGDASLARDLASLINDTTNASRWQRIIDAHATALADRDRAVALILWHTL